MGDEYQYRSADGSNNNPTLPWLGAANTAYARSVSPLTIQPGSLPDPGLIFDSIMARETFTPHPNKVSSVFFAWASLIIHGELDIYAVLPLELAADFRRSVPNRPPESAYLTDVFILGSFYSVWRQPRRPGSHPYLSGWKDQA
jgi:hypothetical protein